MRIIAGQWRGRTIAAPKGDATRPTADRTREALFSMLVSRVGSFEGLSVLDLFAGSGALGLEALSRGAAHASFDENDRAALDALKANIGALKAAGAVVVPQSVMALRAPPRAFDIVLADAPYASGAGGAAIDRLLRLGWIAPGGWVSVETGAKEDAGLGDLAVDVVRTSGKARLTLARAGPLAAG